MSRLEEYEDLIGFVPDGIRARIELLSDLSPEFLQKIEEFRKSCVESEHLSPASVQMIMYALLLADRDEDARVHAILARKAGASEADLLAVTKLAGWLGGAQAFNLGFRVLQNMRVTTVDEESEPG